jgi:uncharacterized membrane protein
MPSKNISAQKNKRDFFKANPVFANYFKGEEPAKRPVSETINRPVTEVTSLLTNIKNLPLFLEYLEMVEAGKGTNTQWHFKNNASSSKALVVPVNFKTVEGEGVYWQAEDSAGFQYSVGVQIMAAPAGRGTVVRMMTAYESAIGEAAGVVQKLFGKDAEATSKKNLQRFKAFCETGHVPTTEGQSSGREEDLIQTKH